MGDANGDERGMGAGGPEDGKRVDVEALKERVIEAIRTVYDPEIPVNIYDIGLVYEIEVSDTGMVTITMTLTSPACPVAEILPIQVESKVNALEGVSGAMVDLVWDPPWTPEKMSEAAKLELGFM
jgi:FeS assembly SUF system protein